MNLARVGALLAVGLLVSAPTTSRAQDAALEVTVPELTPEEVAKAVSSNMDFVRWSREFKGKVVKWSGVVTEPSGELQEWFGNLFFGDLLQLERQELRCVFSVPDKTSYAKGSTLTFTARLEGYIAADMKLWGGLARDKPVIVFAGGETTPLFQGETE